MEFQLRFVVPVVVYNCHTKPNDTKNKNYTVIKPT